MRVSPRLGNKTYHLVLADDGEGQAQTIEFEAASPDAALFLAERHCGGREAELFDREHSLGRLRCSNPGGFWILSPATADPRQS